jgi:hypothetical protein
MSGEDAPRPCLENLIVLEIKTNKQELHPRGATSTLSADGVQKDAACTDRAHPPVQSFLSSYLALVSRPNV